MLRNSDTVVVILEPALTRCPRLGIWEGISSPKNAHHFRHIGENDAHIPYTLPIRDRSTVTLNGVSSCFVSSLRRADRKCLSTSGAEGPKILFPPAKKNFPNRKFQL
jgi:hypothetical protein